MTTSKRKSKSSNDDWQYETSVAQVEQILTLIEVGEMDLADVFEQFTIAIDHLKQCEKFLGDRQQQVDLLIETLSDDEF
jgi:exodeoxyribonuclease VII small subunit